MCVHVYYLLGQTEDGVKFFFGGGRGCRVRLPPRALSCYKKLKTSLLL